MIQYLFTEAISILREEGAPAADPLAATPPADPSAQQQQQPPATPPPAPPAGAGKLDDFIKALNDARALPSLNDGATYQAASAYFASVTPQDQDAAIKVLQGLNAAANGQGQAPQQTPQTPPPAQQAQQVPPPPPAASPASPSPGANAPPLAAV